MIESLTWKNNFISSAKIFNLASRKTGETEFMNKKNKRAPRCTPYKRKKQMRDGIINGT